MERIRVSAMLAIRKSPQLQRCTPESIVESVVNAAQLGVDPGGALGEGYLVSYGEKCQLILGYQGMISIARRSGEVRTIEANIVCENDTFEFSLGSGAFLTHRFDILSNRGSQRGAWAKAVLADGSEQFEVMSLPEITIIRERSKASKSGPWVTDFAEMAKKTVIRRLFKRLPKSLAMMSAVEHDNETDGVAEAPPPPTRGFRGLHVAGGPVIDVEPEREPEIKPASPEVENLRAKCLDAIGAVCSGPQGVAFGERVAVAVRAGDVPALRAVLTEVTKIASEGA